MQDEHMYELISIDESEPPHSDDETERGDWFKYQIAQGDNMITGYRRGKLRTVKREVKTIIVGLNERRSGKRKQPPARSASKKQARN
jgi:phage/plasmid primase-like uncharacterized protein